MRPKINREYGIRKVVFCLQNVVGGRGDEQSSYIGSNPEVRTM